MTPGLARCFGYKRGAPSGTEVGMRPDQAPSAIACSVDTEWPRHAGSKAPLHARSGNGSTMNHRSFVPGAATCPAKRGSRHGHRSCRYTER